eukprot:1615173-Prymnesium_polylepis.1
MPAAACSSLGAWRIRCSSAPPPSSALSSVPPSAGSCSCSAERARSSSTRVAELRRRACAWMRTTA